MSLNEFFRVEIWTASEAFHALVTTLGGPELAAQQERAHAAEVALQRSLSAEQQALHLAASDARTDSSAMWAAAAARVALLHGVAMGAALQERPDAPTGLLLRAAGRLAGALLGTGLPPTEAKVLAGAVERALSRAMAAGLGRTSS